MVINYIILPTLSICRDLVIGSLGNRWQPANFTDMYVLYIMFSKTYRVFMSDSRRLIPDFK